MDHVYEAILPLTTPEPAPNRVELLMRFARAMGWRPSDSLLDEPIARGLSHSGLVVEHGLSYSAVIAFLHSDEPFTELPLDQQRRLTEISYNSLIDWQVNVHPDEVAFVYNRVEPVTAVESRHLSARRTTALRREEFEQVTGRRPNPNLPALDEAIVATIADWRRRLAGLVSTSSDTGALAALFSAIILGRAIEDQRLRQVEQSCEAELSLIETVTAARSVYEGFSDFFYRALGEDVPAWLLEAEALHCFDHIDHPGLTREVLGDFYRTRRGDYRYDFSLMSKHAISCIYEHYVSLLRYADQTQDRLPLFHEIPTEHRDKAAGSVYTPQFVARFFVRLLENQAGRGAFERLRMIDPACGSGIFIRTTLEAQCSPEQARESGDLSEVFARHVGLDIDPNACEAARLSLALLHLVLTRNLPRSLTVRCANALSPDVLRREGPFDAVVMNPPYVDIQYQSEEIRNHVLSVMGELARGRVDLYMALLRRSLDLIRPGGCGLYVLPHSFLINESGAPLRQLIADDFWITCLADVSLVRVFPEVGSYVILLAIQKPVADVPPPQATVVYCRDAVSQALDVAARGATEETSEYSVYKVPQQFFKRQEWSVLPAADYRMRHRIETHTRLDQLAWIREGFVAGNKDVFIRPKAHIPDCEEGIWVPFLPDREMMPYRTPEDTDLRFFYPYIGGERVSEDLLRERFPQTIEYLEAHKDELMERSRATERNWWAPTDPRRPESMMRPKIVTPHIVLAPRFALDEHGIYAVTHAPLIYPKTDDQADEVAVHDLLLYLLGVLNSAACFWYITSHAHVYDRGYALLQTTQLKPTPIPDPTTADHSLVAALVRQVRERLSLEGAAALDAEKRIDTTVARLYGIDDLDLQMVDIGG